MAQVGTGRHTYELEPDFPKLPEGMSFGVVSRVATDSRGRLYVFQRKDPPVLWTGMGGPNDIDRDDEGTFYICEQEADGNPAYITIRDGDGKVLTKWATRHAHGLTVDRYGDVYVGLTTSHSVDKYVRRAA